MSLIFSRRTLLWLLVAAASTSLASCTYNLPARLSATRMGDTIAVALDPNGAARWDPTYDSLIVVCQGCEQGKERIVERFERRNEAAYEIEPTQTVILHLYSRGREDTVITLSGTGTAEGGAPSPSLRRFPSPHRSRSETAEQPTATPKPKPEKVAKKPTQLKVTAPEGVAIYKDKTKKEVLKILPQGTVMTLLSREGDLYSVAVDGGEGFVEAEAVQILE